MRDREAGRSPRRSRRRARARILVSHGGDHLPREDFPRLAQWALDGSLDLASMVTRTAGLDDWSEAFDAMQDGQGDSHGPDAVKSIDVFRGMVAGEIDPPPVAELVGMRMTDIDPGRAVFELEAGPQHASPLGTLHGVACATSRTPPSAAPARSFSRKARRSRRSS